jgi:hypothetical protein
MEDERENMGVGEFLSRLGTAGATDDRVGSHRQTGNPHNPVCTRAQHMATLAPFSAGRGLEKQIKPGPSSPTYDFPIILLCNRLASRPESVEATRQELEHPDLDTQLPRHSGPLDTVSVVQIHS